VPKVSREKFSRLAEVRIRSKVPPGFIDEKRKADPLGDFFVWCDFLLGVRLIIDGGPIDPRPHFVLITDDTKPDWLASGSAHPALVEEGLRVTGARVSITNMKGLDDLLNTAPSSSDETPRASDEDA